mgnify:CR=1 FL=1
MKKSTICNSIEGQINAKNTEFCNTNIQKSAGSRLYDDKGNAYIDLSSQTPYNLLGHNISEIQEDIRTHLETSQETSSLPYENQMTQNHAPITLYFGDIKTAVAKQNGTVLYEVVYIDIVDPFVNNNGVETSATTIRPNAVENMRDRIKELGHDEWTYLPLWMKTQQSGSVGPLGYVKAVPILYCKPGTSAKFKKRIEDLNLDFYKKSIACW